MSLEGQSQFVELEKEMRKTDKGWVLGVEEVSELFLSNEDMTFLYLKEIEKDRQSYSRVSEIGASPTRKPYHLIF